MLPQAYAQCSRGILDGVRGIPGREIIEYVVAHNPGARRTNSRDVQKIIQFSGHVWGNPEQSEARLHLNLDLLLAAFENGVQQLCLLPDGRYWNAELKQFDPKIVEGDVFHCEYSAQFQASDPYAYGDALSPTVTSNHTLANVLGTLYSYSFTLGTAPQLGSRPSALTLAVSVVTANGAFWMALQNTSTTPATTTAMSATPFADGDRVTFDSPNAQTRLTRGGGVTSSPYPVLPILLDATVATPTALTLQMRAASAPVVTITASWVPTWA